MAVLAQKSEFPDEIFISAPEASGVQTTRLLVYCVCGNPGMIEYYRTFLHHLWQDLQGRSTQNGQAFFVYGASMDGFSATEKGRKAKPGILTHKPLGLDGQIDHNVHQLCQAVRMVQEHDLHSVEPIKMILVGHSVGAYILLEIIARWQKITRLTRNGAATSQSGKDSDDGDSKHTDCVPPLQSVQLVGGIGLFPTIMDIAKSPMGKIATPLLNLPFFPFCIQICCRLLFGLMNLGLLSHIISWLTRMPYTAALVTATFLQSRVGVFSALHLARDEMRLIAKDRWTEELWGVQPLGSATAERPTDRSADGQLTTPPRDEVDLKSGNSSETEDAATKSTHAFSTQVSHVSSSVKLFFYWGANDHWVANSTRDAIIRNRGGPTSNGKDKRGGGMPVMEIDRHGIPHAFCLTQKHSLLVAEKVGEWVREVASSCE